MSTAPELRAHAPAHEPAQEPVSARRARPGRLDRWRALPRLLAVATARLIDRCA